MTVPFQLIATVASQGLAALTTGAAKTISDREAQRTVRLQSKLNSVSEAGACLHSIVIAYSDYQKTIQEEQRKRSEIAAQERITLENIRSQRDVFLVFLDASFDEREQNFVRLFDTLDKAVASDDTQKVALILNQIVDLAKSSPFRELQDLSKVQNALSDPKHEWKF